MTFNINDMIDDCDDDYCFQNVRPSSVPTNLIKLSSKSNKLSRKDGEAKEDNISVKGSVKNKRTKKRK